jgi:hypothetical protein
MALNTDFAFEGFRIIRQKPVLIAYWGLSSLVMQILVMATLVPLIGPYWSSFEAMTSSPQANPAMILELYAKMAPGFVLIMLISLTLGAILMCGVYRAAADKGTINSGNMGFGYLRLGTDELRQVVVSFAYSLFQGLVYAGLIIAVVVIIAIMAMLKQPILVGLVGFIAFVAAFAVLVIVALRLSLCGPQSFYERKINLFGSWKLTKGVAGSLFGGYFLASILGLLILILAQIIIAALVLLLFGFDMGILAKIYKPDFSSFATLMTPAYMVYLGVSAIVSALIMALFHGAVAQAYRQLKG